MTLEEVIEEIDNLEHMCSNFLTAKDLDEESLRKSDMDPSILDIKAFNAIVSECKDEVKNASYDKITDMLKLLFELETDYVSIDVIELRLEKFVNSKLNSSRFCTEKQLDDLKKITQNIDSIYDFLRQKQKQLHKDAQNFYVFNKKQRRDVALNLSKLSQMKKDIELQMEYDAKMLVNSIIKDFYNIYIFFSLLIYVIIAREEELLSIEIANELDRFTKVIGYIFNKRTLSNKDMLYYYATYELDELKQTIYSHIAGYDDSI